MRLTFTRLLALGAVLSTIVFGVATAGLAYHWQFRPGWAFLVLGWMALLGTAWFLGKAVTSFDMTEGDFDAALAEGQLQRADLEMEKHHLLKAIKEVEFDRETGKIDEAEAAEVIARYRARAIDILRVLEGHEVKKYEQLVEDELLRRLEAGAPEAAPAAEEAAAAAAPAPAAAHCPSCGLKNDEDAAFCKKCGARLGSQA